MIFLATFCQLDEINLSKVVSKMQTSQTQITNFDETNLKYFHMLGDQQWIII